MKKVVQDLTSGGIDWQREKWQSGLGSKFIHQGEKNAVKYADEVIVLSKGLQDYFKEIRGLQNGYQRGYGTLKKLREMGMKDVGFGMTVQDKNAPDLVPLYKISDEMGMEFATASLHNSFYFVEAKNIIHDRPMVAKNFENLVNELLRSNSPKKWFRAYFNHGLINYIYAQMSLLPDAAVATQMTMTGEEEIDLSEYEIVRPEFFAHIKEPALTVNVDKIGVNTACVRLMPDQLNYNTGRPIRLSFYHLL